MTHLLCSLMSSSVTMPTLCEEDEEEQDEEEEEDSAVEDMRGSWGEASDGEGWSGELREPTEDTVKVDPHHLKMVHVTVDRPHLLV